MAKYLVDSENRLNEVTTYLVEAKSVKEAIKKVADAHIKDEEILFEDFTSFWEQAYIFEAGCDVELAKIKFKELIYKEFGNKNIYRGLDIDKFYNEAKYLLDNDISVMEASEEFRMVMFKYAYKKITAINLNKLRELN